MASFHAIGRALTFGALGPAKVDPNKPLSPFAQAMNQQTGRTPNVPGAPSVSAPSPTNAGSLATGPQPPDAGLLASSAAKAAAAAGMKLRKKSATAAAGGVASQFGGSLATPVLKTPTLSGY